VRLRENGITIFDACPTKEAFEKFSTSAEFRNAAEAAGFPGLARSRDCRFTQCTLATV
jgi:hypothetical protein